VQLLPASPQDFISKVEALDYALRQKDQKSALAKLEATKSSLDTVLAAVL
jgi:photosystem II oxygen-evolving enhancer protein 3